MSETLYIDRPPRIQPELPFDEIEIPGPPDKDPAGWERLVQVALPIITIIGYIALSATGAAGRSPAMMIPMALSVVGSTGFAIYSYFREKRRRAEQERAYSDRLTELTKEMNQHHDQQRRFYRYNYPDVQTTFRLVASARSEVEKAERTLRAEARLWERRVSDDDFGVIRLGMGTLPSTVRYVLGDVENMDDPQVREAMKLETDSLFVSNIPVIVSLRQPPEEDDSDESKPNDEERRTPVTHALSIAGERASVYEYVRSMLAHFMVFHAPMNARLFVLATHKREWAWTEHSPHSQGDESAKATCFVEEARGEKVDTRFSDALGGELEQFLEGLRKTLSTRKIRLQDRDETDEKGDPTQPFMLVVVDLLDSTYDEHSPLNQLESDAAISILLEEGAALGAAVIFLVPERSKAPGGCRAVLEIEKTTPATNNRMEQYQRLHFRYAEVGVNSFRYIGAADSIRTPSELTDLARQLAELDVRQGFGANLTSTVPFMELMGFDSMQQLTDEAWRNWQDSVQPRYANWLRARIGRMAGNKPRTLTFSAKRDGVHGMVAGSTGSGKSELLISLITAMAVTYDPTVLNFVLVDYKGGGAFKEFVDLPHCVDIITNLAGEGVTRMFTAINAEMRRRQKLNADTGTKNIVDYREQGLHQSREPYPFLFIIIDEFAEMIADRPEYRAELESITRLGRAQGISLILAAQRPSGVTDQMRSNIKFRISLRVETPGESREMLRRADAAFLPSGIPGRGYLQVGNEEIELIQVAYSGDKLIEGADEPDAPVLWPQRQHLVAVAEPDRDQEPPELYKAVIARLNDMARQNGVEKQRAPWPDFLPESLTLQQTLIANDANEPAITSHEYLQQTDVITLGQAEGARLALNPFIQRWLDADVDEMGWVEALDWETYAVRPVVGLIDNPYAAAQLPLVVELQRGHMVLFGASGWGKTTFVRSLVVSLAASHSPNHLHAYVLDLGGRNLGKLAELPHVGAVISPDSAGYEERVEQLLRELDDMVQKRKELLSDVDADDIYQYNRNLKRRPDAAEPLPAVVVVIDNFVEFRETFGNDDDNVESPLDRFVALARQSKPYGIHFVITAQQLNVIPSQVYSLFTERLTLKLADPTEYRAIVGGHVGDMSEIPGRGYIKIGRQPLSFQVAMPLELQQSGVEELTSENQLLEVMAQNMRAFMAHTGYLLREPVEIKALPTGVNYKQLLAREYALPTDASFLDGLRAQVRQNWAQSLRAAGADWLQTTIGVISGNRPRPMHLEAKRDGVHGLIAGGTGSGKSELLMTLIVDLALRYDPSVLNFVLVDYKGGGAFKPFEALPHCVDIVTNLNKAAVHRMFTAINAEMQRRQALNADTGTKDIVDYRARGLHQSHAPYPHLFIIIDEYAEMISDSPEFRDELESITRVGRAQGVNLLLASQRPIGVTDQMRANIKFRICLRVEGVDTSREMLRRSDAAYLPNAMPGRGYLQVGNDNIELIQIAYTGDSYEFAAPREDGEQPKFYDVMVGLTNELLTGQRPRTPWPPFLPKDLTMSTPILADYLDKAYAPAITLGRSERLCVNPFVEEWLNGRGSWAGVDWNRTALRGIPALLDDPFGARQLPLILDFTRGHAVLFGASGWGKTTFIRALIVSLAATHSPSEFQAHILDLGGRSLEALRALPHVGTVIVPDEPGYEERVQQILRELNDIVDQRKRLFNEAGAASLIEYNSAANEDGSERVVLPAMLLVVDNFGEYIESFGDQAGNNDDNLLGAFVALARQGKAYGIHFLITIERLNAISSKLYSLFTERLTFKLADANEYVSIVGKGVGELEEAAGRGLVRVDRRPLSFQVALLPDTVDEYGQVRNEARQVRRLGQQMHEAIQQSGQRFHEPLCIDALPKASFFRQVLAEMHNLRLDKHFLDDLRIATEETWAQNRTAEAADWLAVTVGITSGNRKRTLELEAKKDGVHGMIAGGTGSGKSELLMTLIVGLALNYSPDILNFVLVDYKGGGAFKPFEKLPHCVDIVTNLNKAAVARMFTAINAEIRRRQALNVETNTKDIVDYRRRGFHLSREPYPHLFIIIDEYAEMIDDNPDYRAELESITRVGRAQGVNLLLASQRPKGVSDQMRANIKLRICLRVEELDTSREMLRRPDAALLPNGMPGRGYLQIGNENIELIQVSWTGEAQPDERDAPVLWPTRPQIVATEADEETPAFFDAAVTLAHELSNWQMAPKPWPSFLPQQFSLQSSLVDAMQNRTFILVPQVSDWLNGDTDALWRGVDWRQEAMRPVVGLIDDPSEARQEPLRFDLTNNHLVIMGDSGWGKTTMLRTIITSLAVTHTPDELHVYILDLGGRNYRAIEELPHVGGVIYAADEDYEERLNRLIDKLTRMVDLRQQFLSDEDASSLYEYNQRNPTRAWPAVLVVIDNFAELQENYEMLVENTLMPLVRRSLNVGISFAASCNVPNNMASKLYSLFGERVTFKQTNTDRYMDIVGRGAIEIDDIAGRGYRRVGGRPLFFQVAQPVGLFGEEDGRDVLQEGDELRLMARQMQRYIAEGLITLRTTPDPIPILEEIVPLHKMLEAAKGEGGNRLLAVLGQSADFKPALIDLARFGPHFAIVGPPLSGKTTVLYDFVLSVASHYTPEQAAFVLIDMQARFADYGGQQRFDRLPHVLAYITEIEQLEPLVERLQNEGEAMKAKAIARELFIIIDNFDDFAEEVERHRDLQRQLSTMARAFGVDGLHFVIGGVLDSGTSELRRRVQSSNYGIGLRNAAAVETLRVMRTPAGLRDKELPVGRGYLVRSGQATMLQTATPYESLNGAVDKAFGEPESENDEQKKAALDRWIIQMLALHPPEKARWSDGAEVAGEGSAAQMSERAQLMLRLLQGAMQVELHAMQNGKNGAGANGTAMAQFVTLDVRSWQDEKKLLELIKGFWLRQMGYGNLDEGVVATLTGEMNDEDYLQGVEQMLADADIGEEEKQL